MGRQSMGSDVCSVQRTGRRRGAVSVRVPYAGTDPIRTKGERRPRSTRLRIWVGRLQRQSQVANPERRPNYGYRQVIQSARRRAEIR